MAKLTALNRQIRRYERKKDYFIDKYDGKISELRATRRKTIKNIISSQQFKNVYAKIEQAGRLRNETINQAYNLYNVYDTATKNNSKFFNLKHNERIFTKREYQDNHILVLKRNGFYAITKGNYNWYKEHERLIRTERIGKWEFTELCNNKLLTDKSVLKYVANSKVKQFLLILSKFKALKEKNGHYINEDDEAVIFEKNKRSYVKQANKQRDRLNAIIKKNERFIQKSMKLFKNETFLDKIEEF